MDDARVFPPARGDRRAHQHRPAMRFEEIRQGIVKLIFGRTAVTGRFQRALAGARQRHGHIGPRGEVAKQYGVGHILRARYKGARPVRREWPGL